MKITRTPLDLNALSYSREWDVERSTGVHLMPIVTYIGQTLGLEKKYDEDPLGLDNWSTAGFLWEHVMAREEKLEHALSVEALRMHLQTRKELVFPGEMYWCRQCDRVMTGGLHAQKHARRRRHTGIYSTPDAYDFVHDQYVEWKFTWKSSRRSEPETLNTAQGIWKWPVQCMWNCMTLNITSAKLIALHCNGSYVSGLNKPEPYEVVMEFTEREIRRNKAMIVNNAVSMGWI